MSVKDLAKFDVPTLVLHGEDDLVPVKDSAVKSARLIKGPPRRSATRAPPRHHSQSPGSGQRGSAGLPGELATQRGFLGSSRPHARTHRSSGAFHGATGGRIVTLMPVPACASWAPVARKCKR